MKTRNQKRFCPRNNARLLLSWPSVGLAMALFVSAHKTDAASLWAGAAKVDITGAQDEFLMAATTQNLRRMEMWLSTGPPGHSLSAPA